MTPEQLVVELERVTEQLLAASGSDIECIDGLLACRAEILAVVAATPPSAFAGSELACLREAARKGQLALENLTLLRRRTAVEGLRLDRLRAETSSRGDQSTFCLSL